MKSLFMILAMALLASPTLLAQKVLNKTYPISGKKLTLKLDFADTIRVERWDKNTAELVVTVNLDQNRYNDYYSLKESQFTGEVSLVEKIDFEGIQKASGCKRDCNFKDLVNYRLRIPAETEFNLKTISGNIILVKVEGKMTVNSISGFVDYTVPSGLKAKFELSSISGDVYSNLTFDAGGTKELSFVGTKQRKTLNGGTLPIEIKTISGNIFLRKS
ncbi:MAG: DUF4097 family beta strand repeat-containing protein [Marinilabiliales bacterium]|nr:DUF4097 family beta strand repeat-containing protein [Marinilabiliales bacterium]